MVGDFNAGKSESVLAQFLHDYNAVNIIHKNKWCSAINSPTCIDLIITNCPNSFQSITLFCTALSDFHNLLVTVLKTSFREAAPKQLHYRNHNKFNAVDLKIGYEQNLAANSSNFENFEQAFLALIDKHAPNKSKNIRANQVVWKKVLEKQSWKDLSWKRPLVL